MCGVMISHRPSPFSCVLLWILEGMFRCRNATMCFMQLSILLIMHVMQWCCLNSRGLHKPQYIEHTHHMITLFCGQPGRLLSLYPHTNHLLWCPTALQLRTAADQHTVQINRALQQPSASRDYRYTSNASPWGTLLHSNTQLSVSCNKGVSYGGSSVILCVFVQQYILNYYYNVMLLVTKLTGLDTTHCGPVD